MQRLRITVNGRSYDVTVEELGAESAPAPPVAAGPVSTPRPMVGSEPPPPPAPARATPPAGSASGAEVLAPLPGVVTEVRVESGQAVAAGEVLLVLEAMKMDNDIPAPRAGTVREVRVQHGDQVAARQVLVVLE